MCGLVFIKKTDKSFARKTVWKRYVNQKTRGSKGFGYVAMRDGKILNIERAKYENEIEKELKEENASEILFHHRFPTSTENMIEATHPIEVQNAGLEYDYYVAHNGVISNDSDLKVIHEKLGFTYTTLIRHKTFTRLTKYSFEEFNDSEALAIELALVLDAKKDTVDAKGSAAFICLQAEKVTGIVKSVFFGRNHSNPLKLYREKNFISITSEGAGVEISADTLFKLDMESGLVTERPLKIAGYATYTGLMDDGYGGYSWRDRDPERAQYIPLPAAPPMPDKETAQAVKDYAEMEDIVLGLQRDLEVLEERRNFLISMGEEEGEVTIREEIEKKKEELQDYEREMYAIAFQAGAFDPTD